LLPHSLKPCPRPGTTGLRLVPLPFRAEAREPSQHPDASPCQRKPALANGVDYCLEPEPGGADHGEEVRWHGPLAGPSGCTTRPPRADPPFRGVSTRRSKARGEVLRSEPVSCPRSQSTTKSPRSPPPHPPGRGRPGEREARGEVLRSEPVGCPRSLTPETKHPRSLPL